MISRASRFFFEEEPQKESALLDKHKFLTTVPEPSFVLVEALAVGTAEIPKPDELSWWDWTVFLLHSAAEIEHALMVQYLYAAYSLDTKGPFVGPQVPSNAAQLTKNWQRTILRIAREEMGHLLTVQNLLRLVGGPLCLERESFPYQSELYPFPFKLERLTQSALAKYITAEMPAAPKEPIDDIIEKATGAAGGVVNRVGRLYATLEAIFQDAGRLKDADLHTGTATDLQGTAADWRGSATVLAKELRSRQDAVDLIRKIGEQGEGPWEQAAEAEPSHFDKFLKIYREFPDDSGAATWVPSFPVATNPVTAPATDSTRITEPTTLLWAKLANVRYRMLLVCIAHALHTAGPTQVGEQRTPKGNLIDWAFEEMHGREGAGVRGLARRLARLPLKAGTGPGEAAAGIPFELPYTLNLPDGDQVRWRVHLALLASSDEIIGELEPRVQDDAEDAKLLAEFRTIDTDRKRIVGPLAD